MQHYLTRPLGVTLVSHLEFLQIEALEEENLGDYDTMMFYISAPFKWITLKEQFNILGSCLLSRYVQQRDEKVDSS